MRRSSWGWVLAFVGLAGWMGSLLAQSRAETRHWQQALNTVIMSCDQ